jgi:hypothetical protein
VTERARHVKLAVDVGSDPITGSLAVGAAEPRDFSGWIELVAAIEAVRYDGGDAEIVELTPGVGESAQLEKRLG